MPIINENDSVAVEELKFGDNDRLSGENDMAMLAGADLLIILTQVDGLLDEDERVIPLVHDIDEVKRLANGSKRSIFSRAEWPRKPEAVRMAADAGITTVIYQRPSP